MSKPSARISLMLLVLASAAPPITSAQIAPDPTSIVGKSVAVSAAARLCQEDAQLGLRQLVGELGMNAGLNVLALPSPPSLPSGPITLTPEATLASWIIATDMLPKEKATNYKLRPDEHERLDTIRFDLVEYLRLLERPPPGLAYSLAPGSTLGHDPGTSRGAVLESSFAPVLGGGRVARITLTCTNLALRAQVPPPKPAPGKPRVVVRGKIDDLAVMRSKLGEGSMLALAEN